MQVLAVSDSVRISGLQKAPALNGSIGQVVQLPKDSEGRAGVSSSDPFSCSFTACAIQVRVGKKTLAVARANLTATEPAAAAGQPLRAAGVCTMYGHGATN